jgi:phosphoribosyl 1,2-cyclic phosphodiesterase
LILPPSTDVLIATPPMSVTFWGVRGSVPCPGADSLKYGGNTACVEIRCGEHILIFDAGTGIRRLGDALAKEGKRTNIELFLSHYHIDHVIGLPFFKPLHMADCAVSVWGANGHPAADVEQVLRKLISDPLFPVSLVNLRAQLSFRNFRPSEILLPRPGVTVHTAPLCHPGGATGYRVDYAGRSVAYLTDTEFPDDLIEPAILALADRTDLIILDCSYTTDELALHAGWGHASWEQGVRLANVANAKRLCLFHHDPDHDDMFMDAVAEAAAAARPGTTVAAEGMSIDL